jgi:penicillin G amidase
MKGKIQALMAFAALAGLFYVLGRPVGPLPALGRILNPYTGLWQMPLDSRLKNEAWSIPGFKDTVTIFWDEAHVPHIQAREPLDAYRAQGFMHASQRFFQMDVQARFGGCRLGELIGERGAELDRFFLGIGLREAGRRIFAKIKEDPETLAVLEAYTAGVNDWLASVGRERPPTEYRLLGLDPEPWRPEFTAQIVGTMSFRLAGRGFDLVMTSLRHKFGAHRVEDLFPETLPARLEAPFIGKVDLAGVDLPRPPQSPVFESVFSDFIELIQPMVANGSNNWAVGPAHSRTGASILANDAHLGLSLPSIWFESQIEHVAANTYGAGFSGAPGIWIGFNRDLSWGVTNGTDDVMDWYEVKFKDSSSLDYQVPGGWRTADAVVEKMAVRGRAVEDVAVPWTELGPVLLRRGDRGLVLHWTVHTPTNVFKTFLALNRARNIAECQQAFADYLAPVQNVVCADRANIAIQHSGAVPVRWRGQGRYVMNAADPAQRWRGTYDFKHWPREVNPARGYVWSANQRPLGGESPMYLGWDSEDAIRGLRIRELLQAKETFIPEDFVNIQSDNLDALARAVAPLLISHLRDLNARESAAAAVLRNWNFVSDRDSAGAGIFHFWWLALASEIWEDQLGHRHSGYWPKNQRLQLLVENLSRDENHPDRFWTDDVETSGQKESLADVVNASFKLTVNAMEKNFSGRPEEWKLGLVRPAAIPHIGRIPGFHAKLPADGSRFAVNATGVQHAPTWRMVVAMDPGGKAPRAWTSLAGGFAGDPLSKDYRDGLAEWARNQYKEAVFLEGNAPAKVKAAWRFSPANGEGH